MDWVASWDPFDRYHERLHVVMLAGTCWHWRGEWVVGKMVADEGFTRWWDLVSFIDAAGSGSWLCRNHLASQV